MSKNRCGIAVLLFALPVFFAMPAASAADAPEALAKQLVEVLRLKDQFAEFKNTCLSPGNFGTPEQLVEKSSNYFSGIKPGNPKWPAIARAWQKYQVAACSVPTEEQALAISTRFYREHLTEGQLKSAIKFYSSADGKVLAQANQEHTRAFYGELTKLRSDLMPTLTAEYQKEITGIIKGERTGPGAN